ncbi:MAG: DNA repair protein RecN [Lachnospiraceae bacterium]|nr:DNA repair protein RecN [Lachnospiraceae bacterium]
MLLNMHIKNIALIDEIDISFEDKLNILTGETGAGKSIIIGSLGICLGGKFQKELLRDEEKDGLVELLFTVDSEEINNQLLDIDVDSGDEREILISRRLSPNGRTINRINDNTVTTSKLKEVAAILIDLHAQHEQQTLLKASKHMDILDKFGGDTILEKRNSVAKLYKEYVDIASKIRDNSMDEAERVKQVDYLKYRIDEIKNASLKEGEDEELESFYKKAVNSKEILATADNIYKLTGYNSQDSAADFIGRAVTLMGRLTDLDGDLAGTYTILQDVDGMLNDFNRELNQYMKDMEFDPQEFNRVEERLNQINSLKSKYGRTIPDIKNNLLSFETEYSKLLDYEDYMNELLDSFKEAEGRLKEECDQLTALRKDFAKELCQLIKNSLEELNFMSVEFDMEFNKLEKYSPSGNDDAFFVISTNVGEKMRPLYEVASGGELSRVMLAIKSCLAYADDTPTLIFDEIDVGISGRTAQKVAEKMSVIARKHQVICITHLPQIAAMADTHYVIEKNVENNKTITNIRKLTKAEEIHEIARLLGGAKITEATIFSAKEMKGLADREKLY